jgi:hypothetical protein
MLNHRMIYRTGHSGFLGFFINHKRKVNKLEELYHHTGQWIYENIDTPIKNSFKNEIKALELPPGLYHIDSNIINKKGLIY